MTQTPSQDALDALSMARDLICEAKGAEGPNGGFVTNHLDAAESWLDKIEAHLDPATDKADGLWYRRWWSAMERVSALEAELAHLRSTSPASEAMRLLREARGYVDGNHDEGCELDPEYGEQNMDDEDGELERYWPDDAKCTCGTDELLARIDALAKGGAA